MNKLFFALALLVATTASARSMRTRDSFTLFNMPLHKPNTSCERAVKMDIDYLANTITLNNTVIGGCEIAVFPNTRVFRMEGFTKDACGSYVAVGKRRAQGGKPYRLTVSDNRQRVCRDLRAPLEVSEVSPDSRSDYFGLRQ